MYSNTHLFSLYVGTNFEKKHYEPDTLVSIRSPELARRMFTILRLNTGERIQLFSESCVLIIALEPSQRPKDTIIGRVIHCMTIAPQTHRQSAYIGLLKKESFEEAVHHATVTGATHIIPLITAKSRKSLLNPREAERLTTIMIAACEQSKNYHIPKLENPQLLATALSFQPNTHAIGFEATGQSFLHMLSAMGQTPMHDLQFFIGPEGGFTQEECTLMKTAGVSFYQLTPTILRSQEAVCLAGGMLSALRNGLIHSS